MPPKTKLHRTRLEQALTANGKSIRDLAHALGLTYATVWKAVAGAQQMTKPRAERYARALGRLGIRAQWHEIM